MRDFRELKVWQKAHRLALDVYQGTRTFPTNERYGVTAQIRRAAASIPTNIAEGCGRNGDREVARFMVIAAGSASETEYLLLLAQDLGYFKEDMYIQFNEEVIEIKRMLNGFIQFLRLNR
jgi:four helix bundle protein